MDDSLTEQLDNLKVSPSIDAPPPHGLGFTLGQIRYTCENHSDTQLIRWDELQVLIFAKAFGSHTDVVGIGISEDPWTAVFGFRVFPDLCEKPLAEFTPLQIVRLMAERFGLTITIGDKSGKFFSEQEVEISAVALSGFAPGPLVRVNNPDDRFYVLTHAIESKDHRVRIALAFSIDTMQYWQWANDR